MECLPLWERRHCKNFMSNSTAFMDVCTLITALLVANNFYNIIIIMRPSSLGGGRIMRRTLSVCPSVCLSVCLSVRPVTVGHVFSAPLASRMYFSARTEGRISYGHLGRTDSC